MSPERQDTTLAGVSVLVAEGNQHMRGLLRDVLRALGCRDVRVAQDAEAALAMARERLPDALITEYALDPFDGIRLVRQVRRGKRSPDPMMPIVMVTAYTEQAVVERARDAGINEFLAKPISGAAIYAHLHAALTRPRPYVEAPAYFGPDRRRRGEAPPTADRRRSAPRQASRPGP